MEATVWMVPLRRKDVREYKGTIVLADEGIVFSERKSGTEFVIPLPSIRRAKRLRGSPVLMVRHGTAERLETAFYFAPPPPLRKRDDPEEEQTTISFGSMLRGGRTRRPARERRVNAHYLTSANSDFRHQIEAWVRAIEKARSTG